jgi:hypothetical protein
LRRSLLPAGSHLKLRGYRWAYRRAVPVDLQAVLGRTEIVRSLRTGDLGRAARLADAFDAVVSRLFSVAARIARRKAAEAAGMADDEKSDA